MRYFFVSYVCTKSWGVEYHNFTYAKEYFPSLAELNRRIYSDWIGMLACTVLNIQELSKQDYLDFIGDTSDGK